MKKHYYLYVVAILALVAILPVAVRAEEGTDDDATPPPVTEQVPPGTVPPPPRPGTNVPKIIRDQRRGGKAENIQNNVELRNKNILENRRIGSSTRPDMRAPLGLASTTRLERKDIRQDRREEVGDLRREGREDMKNASSTGERREIRKDMRMDIFKVRKDAIIKQLTVSLNNLKQIRDRIASRIEKASSEGRDMTKAKSSLISADAKIQDAINAVEALKAYTAPTPTASSTDAVVDLVKPRQVGEAAIKAVKAAHEALVATVRAIAQAMGLGNNASTTPPVIPPPPTATSTQ
jgi:hypothetical protein